MAPEDDLNCRLASRLLSLAGERALTEGELRALRLHLDECLMCVNFDAQLRFLHKAAKRYFEG
jgi:hypothetical protein